MDRATLQQLAQHGLESVGGDALAPLADWCWDWCEDTGNGAYGSISVTLRRIDNWWSEYSTIPTEIFDALDELLRRDLPRVLAEEDVQVAARRARSLRLDVEPLLVPPEQWPTRSLTDP